MIKISQDTINWIDNNSQLSVDYRNLEVTLSFEVRKEELDKIEHYNMSCDQLIRFIECSKTVKQIRSKNLKGILTNDEDTESCL